MKLHYDVTKWDDETTWVVIDVPGQEETMVDFRFGKGKNLTDNLTDNYAPLSRKLSHVNRKTGILHHINVDIEHRGRGIGNELMHAALAFMRKEGVEIVYLHAVGSPGFSLEGWYAGFGFEPVDIAGEGAGFMRLSL